MRVAPDAPAAPARQVAPTSLVGETSEATSLCSRLFQAESRLAELAQSWRGVLFHQRPDFSFESILGNIQGLTGVPPATWLNSPGLLWDIVHEADVDQVRNQCRDAAATAEAVTTTYRVRHAATGTVSYVLEHRKAILDNSGLISGYIGMWLDVTRQTIAEKRLVAAAWKETLATLTTGLAHDFNNLLSGILSLTELVLAQSGPDAPSARSLDLIKQTTLQASQLLKRIVNLHRAKTGVREYLDLNQVVPEVVELVRKVLPRHINIETALPGCQLPVYIDGVAFRQVLLNLALNAADAMPRRGRLVFRVTAHNAVQELVHCHGTFPRLPCLCLSLEDNGSGIAARHLPHLYDPFFTTKPPNKGSGLGLYNAGVFADEHGGAISVESTEGAGATFHLWLPRADFSDAERLAAKTAELPPTLLLVGHAGTATDALAEFLRTHSFCVVATHTPARALELLASEDPPVNGVMILAEPNDAPLLALVPELRERRLASRIILQILGGNTENIASRVSESASLVLSSNAGESVLLHKLQSLCRSDPPS